MDMLQNLAEYYEELFPVSDTQKKFYEKILNQYSKPAHFLGIQCGTGGFEYHLAKLGLDVTGIDSEKDFIERANRKRRTQLMSLRFFQMAPQEITKFLCKDFYNAISCINWRLILEQDRKNIENFFADAKTLLSKDGKLILELPNFDFYNGLSDFSFVEKSSIRSKLYSDLYVNDDDEVFLNQIVETGNSRFVKIFEDKKIYPIVQAEIRLFAKNAGFSQIQFYSDYDETPLSAESECFICVIS